MTKNENYFLPPAFAGFVPGNGVGLRPSDANQACVSMYPCRLLRSHQRPRITRVSRILANDAHLGER